MLVSEDDTTETIIHADGKAEYEGEELLFDISHYDDATLIYATDEGYSGMGVLLPYEDSKYAFYSIDPSVILLLDGRMYNYMGDSSLFDEEAQYQYFIDGNYFYLMENNSYKRGTITAYGDKMFLVNGITPIGSLMFLRASEIEDLR